MNDIIDAISEIEHNVGENVIENFNKGTVACW